MTAQRTARLSAGGELVLEAGGRVLIRRALLQSARDAVTNVSWLSNGEVLSILREQSLADLSDGEEQSWGALLASRVPTPWLTLLVTTRLSQDAVAEAVAAVVAKSGVSSSWSSAGHQLRIDDKDVLQVSCVGGGVSIWVSRPDRTALLGVFGALLGVRASAIHIRTLSGQEEECYPLEDRFSVLSALEVLGVTFPLPNHQTWCGLNDLLPKPCLVGEVTGFTLPF